MNRIFGKKKAQGPAPSLDDATKGLGGRVDSIEEKIAKCDRELKGFKDKIKSTTSPAAKKSLQKRAMEVLKRKRMYEGQRDQVVGQQFNIDQAAFTIESAKANVATVASLKSANQQLRTTLKKDLDIGEVEDLADDMAEMMEEFNDINYALGETFATPHDVDEADLDAELEMLEGELEDEIGQAESTPAYLQDTQLPTQPTGRPTKKPQHADPYGLPAVPH